MAKEEEKEDKRLKNNFWEQRSTHGRSKIFETPEILWDAASQYFKWALDNPLIETIIRNIDKSISYRKVWASRSKQTRAEPIASLYEQNKVKHFGNLADLETEMTTWDAMEGSKSPNRIDSLVWGLTELMLNNREKHISL